MDVRFGGGNTAVIIRGKLSAFFNDKNLVKLYADAVGMSIILGVKWDIC